jgi:predicted PurR-regulated permease PerM
MALGGVSLLFVVKYCIEYFEGPIAESWIDLALVLAAYVLFFLLEPLHKWLSKRWSKGARQKKRQRECEGVR